MFVTTARDVLSSFGKSISKAFVREPKPQRVLTVSFATLSGETRTFEVCFPARVLDVKGHLPSKIYKAELPNHPYGVIALVVRPHKKAPPEAPLEGASWSCRFADGIEVPATVT